MKPMRAALAMTAIVSASAAVGWTSRIAPAPGDTAAQAAFSPARISQRFPDREMRELRSGEIHEEGHAWEMFEWWYGQRAFPNELIPAAGFGNAFTYAKQALPAETSAGASTRMSDWTSIGPDNIGGRVLSIAVDPANANRVWAGTASGGLWLSTTAGEGADAWDLVSTGFPTVAVSGIVIHPTNSQKMWIATGEIGRYGRGQVGTPGARSSYGLGVLLTEDGGATWQTTGLNWTFDQNRAVQALKGNPLDPTILWAATTEGLYKTTNAGTTWTLSNPVLMAMDVVVDPNGTTTAYVSHGQLGVPDDTQAGIYKTTNGGTSWTKLAGGLPTTNFGRTPLAVFKAVAGPSPVYAGVSDASTRQVVGLFRSLNGGTSWTNLNSTNWASSQAWYDNVVAVHPTNSAIVLASGLDLYRSSNGGPNLSQVTSWFLGLEGVVPAGGPEGPPDYVHADSHAITFDPTNPSIIYVGCDGGVFKSTDAGLTWGGKNGGLVTTQFYAGFANGFSTQALALGGLQDNGTVKYLGGPSWSKVFGGDGGWCAIDPSDEDVLYEEYVYSNMYKSTDGGSSWEEIHPLDSSVANFIAPFVISESSPQILYVGNLVVRKTTNGGTTWLDAGGGTSSWNGTPVNTIGVSFTNANYVLASTGSSTIGAVFELRRSTNGGSSWTNVTAGLPNRYLTDITYAPADINNAWIVFSGYGASHVFESTDAGLTWTDRTSNLPDIPCQAVAVDPADANFVYVGTDLGTYRSTDGGASWADFSSGMPPAMILDLVFKKDDRLLRAATFGNGVYERDVTPAPTAAPIVSAPASVKLLELSAAAPNPFREETSLALSLAREARVTVAVFDGTGRRVRALVDRSMPAGASRVAWDGRDDDGRRASAGVYFVKVRAGREERSAKITRLR